MNEAEEMRELARAVALDIETNPDGLAERKEDLKRLETFFHADFQAEKEVTNKYSLSFEEWLWNNFPQ